jgi:3-hydroxyisobutyrate dehydrogenase-like beta-hydroxyacid dehydrogenase
VAVLGLGEAGSANAAALADAGARVRGFDPVGTSPVH